MRFSHVQPIEFLFRHADIDSQPVQQLLCLMFARLQDTMHQEASFDAASMII